MLPAEHLAFEIPMLNTIVFINLFKKSNIRFINHYIKFLFTAVW